MKNISIQNAARELSYLIPKGFRIKLKNNPLARRMMDAIRDLDEPKKVKLRDGTEWTRIDNCPKRLLDPGGAQIGNRLYVICGFEDQAKVSEEIHIFDMDSKKWIGSIQTPPDLPHSHNAVVTDGERFLYIAGGQLGPNCRPAVPNVYCLDTFDNTWHPLPPLPAPRYAGTIQLWNGKLHFVGGADEDRWTPRADHWSLRVSGSAATSDHWVTERPVPVPGMHRSSAIVNGRLYVIGGQQGDFKAIEEDPNYKCTGRTKETYLGTVFFFDFLEGEWQRMADLPIAVSHCDFSCLVIGEKIFLYGGQIYKHPEQFYLRLTDTIQVYDTKINRWAIEGYLPYHLKMPVIGYNKGQVFMTVGQRGWYKSDRPGAITSKTWVASVPISKKKVSNGVPSTNGKKVLLISHELTRSGAPLEILELGEAMINSGADVRFVTLSGDMDCGNVSADFRVPVIPPEVAIIEAADSDLIVVNTSHDRVRVWVEGALAILPELASKTLWLVHEIDIEDYGSCVPTLRKIQNAVFDSAACLNAWSEIDGALATARIIHPGLPESIFSSANQPKHLFSHGSRTLASNIPRLLSRDEIRSALHLRDDDLVILSVGSVQLRKGQRMLLRSVAKAAREQKLRLKLILVGFTSEEEKRAFLVELTTDERKVFNSRLGYTITQHLDALYAASDIHVLNSQGKNGRGETFGRATVHAMAFRLPVLGTNAGGTPEIIEDGVQGYVYPVGEAGQSILIDRLQVLALDPDLRRKLGEAASLRARTHFAKELYLGKINDIIESIFDQGEQRKSNSQS